MTRVPSLSSSALVATLVLALATLGVGLCASGASARLVAGPDDRAVVAGVEPTAALRRHPADSRAGPAHGVWPLRPRPEVVRPFDAPETRWGAGHRGADLAGHPGQPVRTSLAGRVSFVGRVAGRGVVVVDHGGTRTTYEPVLGTVGHGDRVASGAVVGRLSTSGGHCVPRSCLHWGLRRGDVYLDPLTLVDAPRPVRLLPW
jgi:murein DD-endopeptidase MepM/ murein hydrolase activator NlpD